MGAPQDYEVVIAQQTVFHDFDSHNIVTLPLDEIVDGSVLHRLLSSKRLGLQATLDGKSAFPRERLLASYRNRVFRHHSTLFSASVILSACIVQETSVLVSVGHLAVNRFTD
jgi:hypothetical protein